jgi:ABC-type Fe3+/spermidine/putrescine transport system ATPase subunit
VELNVAVDRLPRLDDEKQSAVLALEDVTKAYPNASTPAVKRVSLSIEEGDRIAFLGPSGSGKSTLLHIMAGFLTPDTGRVVIDGKDCTAIPPSKRNIGVVFQDLALFPHMTVSANLAFGLRMRHVERKQRLRRVDEILDLLGMRGYEHRMPAELSGGQRQRVAFGRALVTDPAVLLLDEPFSSLDTQLRQAIRRELMLVQERTRVPTVLVTHDQEEALEFGHRVVVLSEGVIRQVGSPRDVYEQPSDVFVAGFVGDGAILAGEFVSSSGATCELVLDGFSLSVPRNSVAEAGATLQAGMPVHILIRPESLEVVVDNPFGATTAVNELIATVDATHFGGDRQRCRVRLQDGAVLVSHCATSVTPEPGQRVFLRVAKPESLRIFAADPTSNGEQV